MDESYLEFVTLKEMNLELHPYFEGDGSFVGDIHLEPHS
jgi:hypothetical protein